MNNDWEERLTGRLRNLHRGLRNIHTEETRVIRKYGGHSDPIQAARDYERYHKQKIDHLARLHVQHIHDNRKINKYSVNTRFANAMVPNRDSVWASLLSNVPNIIYEYDNSALPNENKSWLYRDQFGHAAANPEQGASYVWPDWNYYGNPWGMGGELYSHLRQGGQQDDKYLWPRKNDTNNTLLKKKSVRFSNVNKSCDCK